MDFEEAKTFKPTVIFPDPVTNKVQNKYRLPNRRTVFTGCGNRLELARAEPARLLPRCKGYNRSGTVQDEEPETRNGGVGYFVYDAGCLVEQEYPELLYGEVAQERMKDSVDVIGRVYRDPFRTLLPVSAFAQFEGCHDGDALGSAGSL